MDTFGAYLKAQREKKGIRLEEIASITKIHVHSLELLETNRWEQLPPEPFIRGFIIAYAKYVGLGTTEVMERYLEATGTPAAAAPAAETVARENTRSAAAPVTSTPNEIITKVRLPSGPKMITAASLIAVIGLAALLINVGKDADAPAIPTQVVMTPEVPTVAPTTEKAVVEAPKVEDDRKLAAGAEEPKKSEAPALAAPAAAAVAPMAHEVQVEGKERSWLKVVIDENPPSEYFLGEGKTVTYRAANKIKVVLGNATGSRVLYNGKEVDGKQFMGTIKSYKFPADARFPQDVPSKRTPTTNDPENAAATPTARPE